jgi:shikimate dehydrogenase
LFLHRAGQGGAQCIGGMEMLVRQGARSFEIWTGRRPELDLMRRELKLHLGLYTDG